MDSYIKSLSSVQEMKKSTRRANTKASKKTNKPVKVVYISNPMKIQTSAAKFRALVQELTGRDSDFPDPAKFPATTAGGDPTAKIGGDLDDGDDHRDDYGLEVVVTGGGQLEVPSESTNSSTNVTTTTSTTNSAANRYDMFDAGDDDVFMPQMTEGFSEILPSSMWYESPNQVV